MKTRRILAASTAALLAFGSVAVVASANENDITDATCTYSATEAASGSTEAQIKGLVSVAGKKEDAQGDKQDYTLVAGTDYDVTVSGTGPWTITVSGKNGISIANGTKTITVASSSGGGSGSGSSSASTAEDVVYDKDWTDIGSTGVAFKIAKADAKKLEDLTIDADVVTVSAAADVTALDSKLKAKVADDIAAKATASPAKAAVYDITVTPEDDDDYTDRTKFSLKAPIQINITGIAFEADHIYHIESGKLVEVKADKLTKKTESGTTTYGVQFTSKSFSPFVISKGTIKGAVALDDEENPANESGTSAAANNGTSNPNTGIALAIAPVVLAAGAVAVVALKKKH